jgi:hypothetical protein
MNAIAQAMAELANRNADRCTVEEIVEPVAPVAPVAPGEHSESGEQDSRRTMLENTIVVFSSISTVDALLLSDIVRRSGGTAMYMRNRDESSINELIKAINSTSATRLVTDYNALPIEAFVKIVNETKVDVVVVNQTPENDETLSLINSKIREQVSCNLDDRFVLQHYPADRTYTQVYGDCLNLSQWFLHQEIYTAYTSDAEFRTKIFLLYINEIPYVQVEEWTNVRLFNLATVNSNDIVYIALVFAQSNKFKNNFSVVSENFIVSDYHYTDAYDYTEFIRRIHNNSEKQYEKVSFFLLFSSSYGNKGQTGVRLISYDSQENNKRVYDVLKELIGDISVSQLSGQVLMTGVASVSREEIVRVVRSVVEPASPQEETSVVST